MPAITPQIATRYTRSHSPPQRTQRTPVSQTAAPIASSSMTPYMWSVSGPTWKTPFGGDGIAARTAVTPPSMASAEDFEREVGRAAALEHLDRAVQVDVRAGGELRRAGGVVTRPH